MRKSLFKQKDYTLLIFGKFISMIGSNMQQFALSLYVFAITNSATIFASMLAISILPRLLMSPVAGVFGDWFDRKKMIVRLDLLNALVLAGFALYFYINQSLDLWLIYALVITLELTEIFFESSSAGIIPSIIDEKDMLEAKSFQSLVISIARLLSPMIAAIVFGFSGLLLVLIVNAISFFISSISEMFINVPAMHKKPEKINLKAFFVDVKEGFSIIRGSKFISTIIALGTIINFVIAPFFTVGFIVLIKQVLQASDFQFGLYQTIIASSMILAPILMTKYIKRFDMARVCVVSLFIMGVSIMCIAVVPSDMVMGYFQSNTAPYIILMALSFIVGVSVGFINIIIGTLFAKIVPIHAMGRTSTVMNLLVTIFIPIGHITFGFLYDVIAPTHVIIMSGSIVMITILIYRKTLLSFSKKEDKQKINKEGVLAHAH